MRSKIGKRTYPWPAAEETPALPPPPPLPPPLEDEYRPPSKKPRRQEPTSSSTSTADGVTTDPPDETPSGPVTPAASLPSAAVSRAPRRGWKPEENAQLVEAVKKHGKHWAAVAALIPGRTDRQCRRRWTQALDPANESKGKWKPGENAKLAEAVKKNGKDWVAVAALVPGRTDRQCRERWFQALDPANGSKGKWKAEENAKLAEAVKKHGKHWVAVAALVPGRTDGQCRHRWVHVLDPSNVSKGKWKPEENAQLAEAVKKHGSASWVAVAALVPGRTDRQCRRRWAQALDPDKKKGEWKLEENAKLVEAVKQHGKDWVVVAALLPGRTND